LHSFEAFDIYNLASLGVAGLIFYLPVGFYRTFAPALIIVYLLLVVRKDYKFLSALLVVNILFFSSFMNHLYNIGNYQIVKIDYTETISDASRIQAEINKIIVYDDNASNPWCNTLLIPLAYYDSRLMLIPPGIGISYILTPETFLVPIKSKYVLFDPQTFETFQSRSNLNLISSLPIGNLYLNRDADCFNMH